LKKRKQETGMKKKAVKLHQTRARFEISGAPKLGQSSEEILESITDAFYAVDADWRLTYLNHRAEKWWHCNREELLGTVLWDMIPEPEKTVGWQMQHQAMLERIPVYWETFSSNLKVWVEANAYPTSNGGIAVYFRDITQHKQLEDELKRTNMELEERVLGFSGFNHFPYIDSHLITEDRHFVGQSNIDIAESVLKNLFHLGNLRAGGLINIAV
jgi:PAS domain S-box